MAPLAAPAAVAAAGGPHVTLRDKAATDQLTEAEFYQFVEAEILTTDVPPDDLSNGLDHFGEFAAGKTTLANIEILAGLCGYNGIKPRNKKAFIIALGNWCLAPVPR